MNMTPAAIVRDYNEAKDKKVQIGILADMNLCEKEEIEKILSENGCELPPKATPKKKPPDKAKEPEAHKKAQTAGVGKEPYQVPGIVKELVNAKMVWLQQAIDAHQDKIKEYEKDLEELNGFLQNCK